MSNRAVQRGEFLFSNKEETVARGKKRYIVFANTDISSYQTGSTLSGYYQAFEREADAEEYAARGTTTGGSTTIAVTTKLVKPKPVELITVELAEEC